MRVRDGPTGRVWPGLRMGPCSGIIMYIVRPACGVTLGVMTRGGGWQAGDTAARQGSDTVGQWCDTAGHCSITARQYDDTAGRWGNGAGKWIPKGTGERSAENMQETRGGVGGGRNVQYV